MKVKIAITIDKDVLEKARQKAKEDGRNLSNYINYILKNQ